MSLEQLVAEARKNKEFAFKIDYWTITRNKQPDLNWIMSLLEDTLGYDYVQDAAEAYIKHMRDTVEAADKAKG